MAGAAARAMAGVDSAADAKKRGKRRGHHRRRNGTQFRDSLDGGVHELLSSLLTVARGIPNNDETFF